MAEEENNEIPGINLSNNEITNLEEILPQILNKELYQEVYS